MRLSDDVWDVQGIKREEREKRAAERAESRRFRSAALSPSSPLDSRVRAPSEPGGSIGGGLILLVLAPMVALSLPALVRGVLRLIGGLEGTAFQIAVCLVSVTLGVGLFKLRLKNKLLHGVIEVLFGMFCIARISLTAQRLDELMNATALIGLATNIYLLVRGLTNMHEAIEKANEIAQKAELDDAVAAAS